METVIPIDNGVFRVEATKAPLRQVMCVPREYVPVVWLRAKELLAKEKKFWEHGMSFEFAYQQLMQNMLQLWTVNSESEFLLAAITQVVRWDKEATLVFVCIGGEEGPESIFRFTEYFENWCQAQGVSRIEARGRKGWKRVLSRIGYEEEYITVTRKVPQARRN